LEVEPFWMRQLTGSVSLKTISYQDGSCLSMLPSSHEVSKLLLPHPSTRMFLGSYTLKNNGFIQPWCLVTGKNTLTKTDGTTFITQYPLL
jgi:hypothetical protein